MNITNYLHYLGQHDYLLHNFLNYPLLNLDSIAAIVDLLENSSTHDRHLLIDNLRRHFHFRTYFPYNLRCNILSDLISDLFNLLPKNLYLNWHFPHNLHCLNLFQYVSLQSLFPNRHLQRHFLIMRQMDQFRNFDQLRSHNNRIDWNFYKFLMNLMHNLLLKQIDFFGNLHSVMQLHDLLLKHLNHSRFVYILYRLRAWYLPDDFCHNRFLHCHFMNN